MGRVVVIEDTKACISILARSAGRGALQRSQIFSDLSEEAIGVVWSLALQLTYPLIKWRKTQ